MLQAGACSRRVTVLGRHIAAQPAPFRAAGTAQRQHRRSHCFPQSGPQPVTVAPSWQHLYEQRAGYSTSTSRFTAGPASSSQGSNSSSRANVVSVVAELPQPKPFTPPTKGFKIHRITGDGSCMFRAIVQGVQFATRGVPMPVESEGTAAQNLRLAVVKELRSRKSEMEPFIEGITGGEDWEGYCSRMEHPSAWGGEPEMVMAVNVVRRPITVWRVSGMSAEPIVTYGEELVTPNTPAINLLWSGAHYDLLVPN